MKETTDASPPGQPMAGRICVLTGASSGIGRAASIALASLGAVSTKFGQSGEPWLRLGIRLVAPVIRSPEAGAKTVVYLASSPAVGGQAGGYYVNGKPRQPSPAARDDDLARQLWEVSVKLTGLDD